MKHWVSHLVFEYPTRVRNRETIIEKSVNNLLLSALKQSWRLRRHPLIEHSDLFQLITGVELPVDDVARYVTDKIEQHYRRIIAFEQQTGCFIVYCPTIYALNDLWAACEQINTALVERLILTGEDNQIMNEYELKAVDIQTNISGPELLKYKSEIGKINKYRLLRECE